MLGIIGSCTTYNVNLSKLSDEIKEHIYLEYDNRDIEMATLSVNQIKKFNIPSSAIDYNSEEIFEDDLDAMVLNLVGNYNHYLLINERLTHNGLNGHTFISNRVELLDMFKEIYIQSEVVPNKAIIGKVDFYEDYINQPIIIIGLSDLEYDNIKEMDYFAIKEFSDTIIKRGI